MAGRQEDGKNAATSPDVRDEALPPGVTRVLFLWDGGSAKAILVPGAKLTVGRSNDCDVFIDQTSISRKHALLIAGDPVEIEDLGSSNGVRVRGSRIEPGQRVAVHRGDVVDLGSVVLILQQSVDPFRGAANAAGDTSLDALDPLAFEERLAPLRKLLRLVSQSELGIVILGETGVGKNVTAQWVHAHSPRAEKPFVILNCAALPEALLEGELFGYEKGAFTGAAKAKPGLIESANGGTLLLDEIGDLPLATQVKLLGVLENREVLRLGSLTPRHVDVRFLAATNRDLDALVQAGGFRSDLHFRINGITVTIPPLRQRAGEIPHLARLFLKRACERSGRGVPELSGEALAWLMRQNWPGNVRELRNVMERAAVLCGADAVLPEHLDPKSIYPESIEPNRAAAPVPVPPPSSDSMFPARGGLWDETDALERQRVLEAFEACGGNQTQTAKRLGISRRALINRLKLFQVPRPRKDKG